VYNGITPYGYQFDEFGNRLYKCLHCLDAGHVHPRRENGTPDYTRTIRCRFCCGQDPAAETQATLPISQDAV
jgi:hypothetical protein